MRQFYEEWCPFVNRQPSADDLEINGQRLLLEIRQPMAGEIDWGEFLSIGFSHHMEIIAKVKEIEARKFYIHECVAHAWDKYTLRDYIKSELYQNRALLPNNFGRTLSDTQYAIKATKTFKENYFLDFINIENLGEPDKDVNERVIETEIVKNIRDFIIRFGTDFIFMGNQYRLEINGEEMFIDLLFFNRALNCLVAVELKTGKFRTSYLGELQGYLSVLDGFERKPHENPSIGLILCKDMNKSVVDYVIQDYNKPMGVATYKTSKDMSDELRKLLPDVEELKRLLDNEEQNYQD